MVNLAYKFSIEAFSNKVDKVGEPYLLHIFRVAENFRENDILRTVAILHDILEDCKEWTAKRLLDYFPEVVVSAVVALTKKNGEDYDMYLQRVSENDEARVVKIADLKDNMNISRFSRNLEQKDIERLEKYHRAYLYLLRF